MPKSILTGHQARAQTISSNAHTNMIKLTPELTQTSHNQTPEIDARVTSQTIPIPIAQAPISFEATLDKNYSSVADSSVSVDEFISL